MCVKVLRKNLSDSEGRGAPRWFFPRTHAFGDVSKKTDAPTTMVMCHDQGIALNKNLKVAFFKGNANWPAKKTCQKKTKKSLPYLPSFLHFLVVFLKLKWVTGFYCSGVNLKAMLWYRWWKKIRRSPPGNVQKPVVNNEINYQAQLVQLRNLRDLIRSREKMDDPNIEMAYPPWN